MKYLLLIIGILGLVYSSYYIFFSHSDWFGGRPIIIFYVLYLSYIEGSREYYPNNKSDIICPTITESTYWDI